MIVEEEGLAMVQLLVDAPIAGGMIVDARRGGGGCGGHRIADVTVDLAVGVGEATVRDVVLAMEEDVIPRIGRYAPLGNVRTRPSNCRDDHGRGHAEK